MNVALFGGTFDPVHAGHLEIAQAAADRCLLDRVRFIPSGRPPHKDDLRQAPYEDRFRMVEIACSVDARFEASRLEDPALVGAGVTYSIDTIERVLESLGAADRLFFLLGEDAFNELGIWYRLEDVLRLVEFIVVSRPDLRIATEQIPGARTLWVEGVANPVSASDIRRRLESGERVDEQLPPGVGRYIRERGLYGCGRQK